jgi:hypothetical protein
MNKFCKINIRQWWASLILISIFLLVSCLSQNTGTNRIESSPVTTSRVGTSSSPQTKAPQPPYLLIFRAYPPHEKKERNLYELAQEIKGFVDGSRFPPSGIMTDEAVRYGVLTVLQAKVLKKTDSVQSPKSLTDGVYLLTFDRTYKFCAKNYVANFGKIIYTDYQDGKKYNFPIKKSGPVLISELAVTEENILHDLWEAKHKSR